jgi:hypothetical protein
MSSASTFVVIGDKGRLIVLAHPLALTRQVALPVGVERDDLSSGRENEQAATQAEKQHGEICMRWCPGFLQAGKAG